MNNKAIMTSFLITVILAIFLFVPTCYGFSKLFRLSDQAKESFNDFSKALEQLPATESKKTSQILILDKDTFVVAYNAPKNTQLCTSQNLCGQSFYPAECNGKNCLCLCREYEGTGFKAEGEDIPCADRTCKIMENIQFADGLTVSNFYGAKELQETPALAEGFFRNGFILARGEVTFSGFRYPFENIRRQFFFITAQGDIIYICKQEEGCKIRT